MPRAPQTVDFMPPGRSPESCGDSAKVGRGGTDPAGAVAMLLDDTAHGRRLSLSRP